MRHIHPSVRQFNAFPSFSELQELCLPDLLSLQSWFERSEAHPSPEVQEARANLLRERLNFFHARR